MAHQAHTQKKEISGICKYCPKGTKSVHCKQPHFGERTFYLGSHPVDLSHWLQEAGIKMLLLLVPQIYFYVAKRKLLPKK